MAASGRLASVRGETAARASRRAGHGPRRHLRRRGHMDAALPTDQRSLALEARTRRSESFTAPSLHVRILAFAHFPAILIARITSFRIEIQPLVRGRRC